VVPAAIARPNAPGRRAARSKLRFCHAPHGARVARVGFPLRILPFLSEAIYQNLVVAGEVDGVPDSVHLTSWPTEELKHLNDRALQASMDTMVRAVDLARTLRSQNGLKVRQPLARMWLALPSPAGLVERDALLELVRDEVNVKVDRADRDESELVDRRVKPLLPKIGKKLGSAIPAVMAAARGGSFEILADGSVKLAGVTLAPDEVGDPGDAAAGHGRHPRRGPGSCHRHRN